MTDYSKLWEQMGGLLGDAVLAPARGMSAQPPQADFGGGLLGSFLTKAHKAIDPVTAFGGYGNMAAMAIPPGAPKAMTGAKAAKALDPGPGYSIVEHFGNRYRIKPFQGLEGRTIYMVDVEVAKRGGGTTWRTLNAMNKPRKSEQAAVISKFLKTP